MDQEPVEFGKLSASLANQNQELEISVAGTDAKLNISFRRTIRVPDNADIHDLPPSMGKFPLLPVSDYQHKMPAAMARKGGVFFPMYQREAMWIRFKSKQEFAIKVHVGDVNAISGEPAKENTATWMRRAHALSGGRSVQDYIATPKQPWLDGICTAAGEVRQFVAMPLGSGYSVETQVTGTEAVGGLWFDVIAKKSEHSLYRFLNRSGELGDTIHIQFPDPNKRLTFNWSFDHTVGALARVVEYKTGMLPNSFRLVYSNVVLKDTDILRDHIREDPVIFCFPRLRGGGGGPVAQQSVAAGGRIHQNIATGNTTSEWDNKNATSFIVQILNSETYHSVTGRLPPPSPVSIEAYAAAGYPFFKFCDEPSQIAGNFSTVKSVNAVATDKAVSEGFSIAKEVTVRPKVSIIAPQGPLSIFRPVEELEERVRGLNIANFRQSEASAETASTTDVATESSASTETHMDDWEHIESVSNPSST